MTPDPALLESPQDAPPAYSASQEPSYRRLTQAELGIMLCQYRDGKTQVAIAQQLGVTQPTISDALKRLGVDTTDLAKHRAKASAYRRVARMDAWSRKRDKIGLDAAKELNQIAGLTGTGDSKGLVVGVQVLIGMPGQPAGPDLSELVGGESQPISGSK